MFLFNLLVILFSCAFCWVFLRLLVPYLRRQFLDRPNERSSHLLPTPRGGGVAFVIISILSSIFLLISGQATLVSSLSLLAAPLAFVGFLDDHLNLASLWRFCVHLFTAILILFVSPIVHWMAIDNVSNAALLLLCFVFLMFSVVAIINFTNFMDGLDGLVGGCMSLSIAVGAIMFSAPWPVWALVGALFGFLFWNWSPAKVFMGDVGSTFLGAVFAGLVLQAPSWPEALGLLLVATPLLGDAFFCVPRRLFSSQQVFQAHRLHLFQRLHQAGWQHTRVSTLYISATAVLAIGLLCGGLAMVIILAALELLLGVWLDQHVAIPFAVASRH